MAETLSGIETQKTTSGSNPLGMFRSKMAETLSGIETN
jgi:hypothetical protein